MSWRKRKCSGCGYLCVKQFGQRFLGESHPFGPTLVAREEYEYVTNYVEITPIKRNNLSELKNDLMEVFCYRHVAAFETELKSAIEVRDSSKIVDIINSSRKCRYYTKHISGYDPLQHLIRWESVERERSNRRWSLLYIVIGAVITAAGAVVIKLIFG